MDALEFLKERKRMCTSCKGCDGCPLEGTHCVLSYATDDEDYERIIATVEQWSKEHPRKTRQSVFLEQYPETQIDDMGVCPAIISPAHRINGGGCTHYRQRCSECRREFWMQMAELSSCPVCGNPNISVVTSRCIGIPSGDNGWCAEIKCKCGADMKFWALKKSWAEKTAISAWNRRATNG